MLHTSDDRLRALAQLNHDALIAACRVVAEVYAPLPRTTIRSRITRLLRGRVRA